MATFENRLAAEKSPYLLQHAHNPVDWFPWGDEAFEKAAKEEKPIFLSIGYATCHWCHVMERESFENEEVARALNETFVCIKVDREERPDIDQIYMSVCHMMTGQGGWPLTIFMTPEKKPFYAATYIPPESRFGRPGMNTLIPRLGDMWTSKRANIMVSAAQITQRLKEQQMLGGQGNLDAQVVKLGYQALMGEYDSEKGGFGLAPKFPTPHKLLFLLRSGAAAGIQAAEHTLTEMRKGGLFDHVGLGFHRYSTDADWLLPHFEKMLYDQALLVMAYTEAFELTRKPFYRQVAEEILTYVLRDMTAPEGGFYSAEDADSEGEEGRFYVWSAAEMESLLGDDYAFAARYWNISSAGNYRDEATGQRSGNNIPHWNHIPDETDAARLEAIRKTLFAIREERIHPLKDTKILADWNGLMIAVLAQAGRVFAEPRYVEAAQKAYVFIQRHMRNGEALWHRYRDGQTAVAAQLEDYAFIIWGLLELYGVSFELTYLEAALRYNQILHRSFKDETHGGYFMTADHEEEQLVRPKNMYDGAIPSGNSVQMYNLLRLARLTGRFELEQEAEDVGHLFGGLLQRAPTGFTQALIAIQFASGKTEEIVIVGQRDRADTQAIIDYIHSVYHPGKVVLLKEDDQLKNVAPFTESMQLREGNPTVYLCRNFACENPITSLEELKKRID